MVSWKSWLATLNGFILSVAPLATITHSNMNISKEHSEWGSEVIFSWKWEWRGLNPLNWHRQLFCFRHEYWLVFFVPKLFSVPSKNTPSLQKMWLFRNDSMMMSTKMKLHLRLKLWVRVITDEWVANGVGRNRQTPFLERSRPQFMRSYNWLLSSQSWCTFLHCTNGDQCGT